MGNIEDKKIRRSPGRPKRDKAAAADLSDGSAREKLLDAASVLFARQGLAATSLAAVAAEAGLTSAMVHYYFATKERLVEAVVAERLAVFMRRVIGDYDGGEPVVFLEGVIARLAEASRHSPWVSGLWIREIVSPDGKLRPHLLKLLPVDTFKQVVAAYSREIKRGKYSGKVDVGLIFFTAISNFFLPLAARDLLEQIPGVGPLTVERLAQHAQTVVRQGLGGRPDKTERKA